MKRSLLGLAALAAPLVGGCILDDQSFAAFDGPTDLAYLPPGDFFEVPVVLATNFRSGRVGKLDMKRSNLLVEDSPAPWLPGPDLAFGADRILGAIALAVGPDTVDVWVGDDSRDAIARAPWISGRDDAGKPQFARPSVLDVVWAGEGTAPTIAGLRLRPGRGTTEDWTLTWDGRAFVVEGTASGLQDALALPGVPFGTDRGELVGTVALSGTAPAIDDRFVIRTEGGVEEADAGGIVSDLLADETGTWIFASVLADDGPGWVSVWDAQAFAEVGRITLPAGAAPERLAAGFDPGTLWIADSADVAGFGRVFRLDFEAGDIDSLHLTAIPVPEPAIDVAEGRDPAAPRVFVAAAGTRAVWMLDGTTYEPIDINPYTPEVDPTLLSTTAAGLAATDGPIPTQLLNEVGTRLESYGVVVTTISGLLYTLDAATGCVEPDSPARASIDPSYNQEVALFTDVGAESNPGFVTDSATGRFVIGHPCGGVVRSEDWELRYEGVSQSWIVEGARSGEQVRRAFEGARYVSDNGAISFTLVPGALPSTDGDRFRFRMDDGVDPVNLQELPGDPLVFTELYDDRDGPYWAVRERQIAVIPHQGNDVVLWVDVQGQGRGLRGYQ